MGGSISYTSTPAVGSLFYFTLSLQPIAEFVKVTADEGKTLLPTRAGQLRDEKFSLLITDDNTDLREILKLALHKLDVEITECTNGLQAVEMVKAQHFDLIFMDIQMPIMDGYSALFNIRAFEKEMKLSRHTVMALTAYATKEDKEKCLKAGFDFYMSKPIKPKELQDFVLSMEKNKKILSKTAYMMSPRLTIDLETA